jgi:hypothetical protein
MGNANEENEEQGAKEYSNDEDQYLPSRDYGCDCSHSSIDENSSHNLSDMFNSISSATISDEDEDSSDFSAVRENEEFTFLSNAAT